MKIILKTNRLYLREFNIHDSLNLFQLNRDKEVLKYTGDIPFKTVEEALSFIENYNDYQQFGFGRWAVYLKGNNKFLGWCGLKNDLTKNEIDIGFRFLKEEWGKGYATEAAKACVDFGLTKLKITKIVGRAYVENKASIEVLKKIGLKFRNNFLYDNKPAVLYTINNDSD